MKLRCDRRELLDRLTLVAGVVAHRMTRPVLQHVLLEVQEKELVLSTSDLEISLRSRLPVLELHEPGILALPALRLLAILREAQGETLDLSTDGDVALLRSSGGQFRLSGGEARDFPELPSGDEAHYVTMPAPAFEELALRTEFAASKELGRYAINGILVEVEGSTVRFVSTDGRRLALAESRLGSPVSSRAREVVPLKAITQVLKAITPAVEVIDLSLGGRRSFFRAGPTVLCATSVEAEFPDFRGVLEADRTHSVLLERDAFFTGVRQAAVMAGDDARAVVLHFGEGSLAISAAMEGLGDARCEVPVDYVGPPVQIALNPDYLTDFSKTSLPEQLPFQFRDISVSALFQPAENYSYAVMPIST